MPIITTQEISTSLHLNKYGKIGNHLIRHAMTFLKISQINELYDRYQHLEGEVFIDAVLNDLGIKYHVSESDLKRIPASGPFLVIANHPLGAIDGLILLKILLSRGHNVKLLANFLVAKVNPLQKYLIPINPFEEYTSIFSNIKGIKQALEFIGSGGILAIFPAGEVSTRSQGITGKIAEKSWNSATIRLIQKTKVPIVPMYFDARNSDIFYFLSAMNHRLRTLSLPSEIFRSRHKNVNIRIGHAIKCEVSQNYDNTDQLADLLRRKMEILSRTQTKRRQLPWHNMPKLKKLSTTLPILPASDIRDHMKELLTTATILIENDQFKVLFTLLKNHLPILLEIAKLRESIFRSAGEGTNQALDMDKYDQHYHHLILWDKEEQAIAGAYRLGMGKEIYKHYSVDGFYLTDLFHMSGPMHEVLQHSIELGRAFVAPKYQQRALPLFLLWQGIIRITQLYPDYSYLIGAASISNSYTDYSKSLMIAYLRRYYFDEDLSHFVSPKRHFKYRLRHDDEINIKNLGPDHLRKMDKMIEEIEPSGQKMPIIIKKYLLQNAKMISFNVDSNFNDAIDGLMYIKVEDIKMSTRNI